ncbi:MAG: DUF1289 domain-containing protein [Glaciecola sp.]|jgi:predicted Fe-S protein YdhL (DUF1289 family)|uniref:DUF1289 domain-containing protein n=2 Tax=Alteromonadales TaxID=135622 RepID=A0AAW8R5E4_9ALTE|nr:MULTISPECIES: DUF1289 domain-containing protein [unclassified Alteromonas]MDT0583285.1 DUF1289 domain-containing protein [Alteromonas sp. W409]MDT0627591.1 DUF1289 domain-containing protein [Alteromonas sp. W364]
MSDMQQLEFFAIPSPCIGVCQSGPRGYCKGCFRSREERLHWLKIDDQTKRIIVKACNRRKQSWLKKQSASKLVGASPEQQDLF